MDGKMILISGLLFAIFIGLLSYGFLTYSLYYDVSAAKGEVLVPAHKMLFIIHLVTQLAALGFGVGVFYKR